MEEELLELKFKMMAAGAQSSSSVLANQQEMLENTKKEKQVFKNQFKQEENTLLELFAKYKTANSLQDTGCTTATSTSTTRK